MSELHAESLLRVPLVRQMLEDPHVPRRARAIDRRWSYEGAIPVSVVGFNPYRDAVYYARESFFARWLADPAGSARDHNEGDFLMYEVWFAVHDYLHVWSAQLIRELVPERRFGAGRVTPADAEAHAFLHLVTEAVATVGLDYWYLSTLDVNDVVPIGTDRLHLATDYREKDLAEFQRARPGFEVQTPAFFAELARFYCTGVLGGFDVNDLRRSAKTLRWLRHELSYGATQRRYTRRWMRFLASGEVSKGGKDDAAPVAITEAWQERVLEEVGQALWRKVKDGVDVRGSVRAVDEPWASPATGAPDFRFVNVNALVHPPVEDVRGGPCGEDNASYLAWQVVSRYQYAALDPELRVIVRDEAGRGATRRIERLCRDVPRVEGGEDEPRDLMILN